MGKTPKVRKKVQRPLRLAPVGPGVEIDTTSMENVPRHRLHMQTFARFGVDIETIKSELRAPDPRRMDAPDNIPGRILRYFYVNVRGVKTRCRAVIEVVRASSDKDPGKIALVTAFIEEGTERD